MDRSLSLALILFKSGNSLELLFVIKTGPDPSFFTFVGDKRRISLEDDFEMNPICLVFELLNFCVFIDFSGSWLKFSEN